MTPSPTILKFRMHWKCKMKLPAACGRGIKNHNNKNLLRKVQRSDFRDWWISDFIISGKFNQKMILK